MVPPGFSLESYLKHSFGMFTEELIRVKARFHKSLTRYLLERRWHPSQKNKKLKDGSLELAFEVAYDYDDGNDWRHEIALEAILQPEALVQYPVCIAGARARPPKDCGGFEGYAHFLRALSDPDHEDHEKKLEWISGEFDSEKFD